MKKRLLAMAACFSFMLAIAIAAAVLHGDEGAGAATRETEMTPAAVVSSQPAETGGEEEAEQEMASSAKVLYAYFQLHDKVAATAAGTEAEALPAAAGQIYVAENLTDDLLAVLYNLMTWARGDSEQVFSEAVTEQAATENGDWYALAVARFGYGDESNSRYLQKLTEHLTAHYADEEATPYTATELARLALTVASLGGDPQNCGLTGDGKPLDLVAAGLASELDKEGVAGLAWGLLLADARDSFATDEQRAALLTRLLAKELPEGGFARAGKNADTDVTALALTALAPYKEQAAVEPIVERSLSLLSRRQQEDGGFTDATTANSVSCAAVLTALSALSLDPLTDPRFIKNNKSVLDGLYKYYVVKDGAFERQKGAGAEYTASDHCFCALVAYYRQTQQYDRFYDLRNPTPTPPAIDEPTDDKAVAELDAAIAKDALPLDVTLADKELVAELMQRYKALTETQRAKLTHGEELLLSQKILQGLADNIVIKEVFELLKGTDNEYVVRGVIDGRYGYSITFAGRDVTAPRAFDARILTTPKAKERIDLRAKKPIYLYFCQQGAFPGKATVELELEGSGDYMLYHYDGARDDFSYLKRVKLGSPFSFEANTGGDYFLSQKQVSKIRAAFGAADFEGGVVPKSVFENLKGENVNLELEGKSDDGLAYKITFNGQDVTEPMDFNCRLSLTSAAAADIGRLAEDPLILHFEHEGALPGQALIELSGLTLPDDTTLLFYYNATEQRAEFVQKVTVTGGATKFIISHCSDYFIAQRALAGPLSDSTDAVTGPAAGINATGSPLRYILPAAILVLLLAGGAALLITKARRRRRKTNNKEDDYHE